MLNGWPELEPQVYVSHLPSASAVGFEGPPILAHKALARMILVNSMEKQHNVSRMHLQASLLQALQYQSVATSCFFSNPTVQLLLSGLLA